MSAPTRRRARLLLRLYDVALLLGAIAAPILFSVPEQCTPGRVALPAIVLTATGLVLGLGRARFRYGSREDLVVLLLAAGVALGAALGASDCGWRAFLPCAVAIALLGMPRLVAAVSRRRTGGDAEHAPAFPGASVHAATVAAQHPRTVWILTLSRPVDEPRVRRQADALFRSGWNVVAIGYKGVAAKPDFWTLVELPERPRPRLCRSALVEVLDPEGLWQPGAFLAARFSGSQAERYYWAEQMHAQNLEDLLQAATANQLACDFVANHDFYTLPLAARVAEKYGVPFTTDVHEYARGQYMHRLGFRLFYSHYVHSLQRTFFPRAALLTVVCRGIADLLQQHYQLQRPPLVIRNVSLYEPMPFRPTGDRIRVLYHGLLCEARGLEETLASLALWRAEFDLVLRGPVEPAYAESLLRLARRHGVESRLRFEPPVPLTELVGAANSCDVGLFASHDYSPQKKFTAPNKLFEYLMAGLALCVSDLPEMRAVVAGHDLGRMFGTLTPEAIADAINGFTRESIDGYKRRALATARLLCWETERDRLIQAYEQIVPAQAAGKMPFLAEVES